MVACATPGRLAGRPGVLIDGRLELSRPLDTAWELARLTQTPNLIIVNYPGRLSIDTMREPDAQRTRQVARQVS